VRVTTAFNRLLDLDGVNVTRVEFEPDAVVVTVALRRRRLLCPECGWSTPSRYDERPVDSLWRHLDMGRWRLEIRARLQRLWCPTHGARTEGVPFARPGSDFTTDFESLVAWLATRTDKTAITRLVRVTWRTVGRIIERVVADELDPGRLDNLFVIGVDEISWGVSMSQRNDLFTLSCGHTITHTTPDLVLFDRTPHVESLIPQLAGNLRNRST
jgi:transposase